MLVVDSRSYNESSLDVVETCTFEYAATRGQYGKVLANDTMVDIYDKDYYLYAYSAEWSFGYLRKATFLLSLL